MTAAEAAATLPTIRYVIEGERNEGETHAPPTLIIREVSELRATARYFDQAGKRRIKTFKRY